jgi:hypothetical protein
VLNIYKKSTEIKKYSKKIEKKIKMNIVGKIIIIFVLLKYVQNQSCSDWKEWKDFKTKFRINFFNNKAETNA